MAKKAVKKITDVTPDPAPGDAPEPIGSMSLGEQLEALDTALQEQQGTSLIDMLKRVAQQHGVSVILD